MTMAYVDETGKTCGPPRANADSVVEWFRRATISELLYLQKTLYKHGISVRVGGVALPCDGSPTDA